MPVPYSEIDTNTEHVPTVGPTHIYLQFIIDMALFLLTKSVLLFALKETRKLDNPYLEIY